MTSWHHFGRLEGDVAPAWWEQHGPVSVAHRCNTPQAVEQASELEFDAVEVDIVETWDGRLLCGHDQLAWTGDITWAVDTDGGMLSSLESVLDAAVTGEVGVYLDLKVVRTGSAARVVACADAWGVDCLVGVSDTDLVLEVHDAGGPASALVRDVWADPAVLVGRVGADAVHPCFDQHIDHLPGHIHAWLSRAKQAAGVLVSWTPHDEHGVHALVDSGLFDVYVIEPEHRDLVPAR
jgi:hypothetical protein